MTSTVISIRRSVRGGTDFRVALGPRVLFLALGALLITNVPRASADSLDVQGLTQPQVDQRRAGSGAKITAETNPGGDIQSTQDSQRLAESYQPKGIILGNFLLFPKLETEESYNSNVFATRHNAKADFITVIRPEVALRSRFDQHELDFHVMAEQYIYSTYNTDNRFEVEGDINGRFDVQPGTEITGFTQLYSRHEDRSSPDEANGKRPTSTNGFVSQIGGKNESGKFTVSTQVTSQRMTFDAVSTDKGNVVRNSDRDRWQLEGLLRGAYEMTPGYAAVTQFSLNSRQYDHARDRSGLQRSSEGYRAEAGLGVDISQLLRGDFLLGWMAQDYQDPRFKDPQGLSARATFNWTPDKLTIVVPSLERSISETTSANASSYVQTSGSILVRHEMARNIMLSGFGSATYEEMSGTSFSDWQYEARGKVTYAFTPNIYIGGEAAYKQRDGNVSVAGFKQTVFMLRLGLQL